MTRGIMILLLLLGFQHAVFAAAPEIIINDELLVLDVAPQIEAGRVLVPLRGIFEALGADVSYAAATRTVQAVRGSDIIRLQIGSRQAWLNGDLVLLDVPARIVSSRTLVPLRFVSEALGAEVYWNETDRQVRIDTPGMTPAGILRDYTDAAGIHRVFRWSYADREEVLEVVVNADRYHWFLAQRRIPSDDYSIYVTHPGDDGDIEALAVAFRKVGQARGYSERALMEYVIAFVQSMAYALDRDANGVQEYPQYPLETLVVKGGDCEDTAILLAALLDALGHEAVIVHYPGVHTGVGLWMLWNRDDLRYDVDGRVYTYVETTVPYPIGRIPPEFRGLAPTFFRLVAQPAIRFLWETNADGMEVRVSNAGTGNATRLYVRATFEGRDGTRYNRSESPSYLVEPGETVRIKLLLIYPKGIAYRYVVEVYNGSRLMAYDKSPWYGSE